MVDDDERTQKACNLMSLIAVSWNKLSVISDYQCQVSVCMTIDFLVILYCRFTFVRTDY